MVNNSDSLKHITNFLVRKHTDSTLLMLKLVTTHDPEPVPSTSHSQNLFSHLLLLDFTTVIITFHYCNNNITQTYMLKEQTSQQTVA
jgi:hypothetical protein